MKKRVTISTLPFIVEGKQILQIGYQSDTLVPAAAGMLAMQGYLAFGRWFDEKIDRKSFYRYMNISFTSVNNYGLIRNLS